MIFATIKKENETFWNWSGNLSQMSVNSFLCSKKKNRSKNMPLQSLKFKHSNKNIRCHYSWNYRMSSMVFGIKNE